MEKILEYFSDSPEWESSKAAKFANLIKPIKLTGHARIFSQLFLQNSVAEKNFIYQWKLSPCQISQKQLLANVVWWKNGSTYFLMVKGYGYDSTNIEAKF